MPDAPNSSLNRPRWLPDLLATRWGRLTAFFFLYVTEGIPLGFTATAVATQMRRQGLSPAEIGAFVGLLYAPWAWKWLVAPMVDLVYSKRFGRRRGWIVIMQCLMVCGLLVSINIDYTADLKLYTAIILLVNIFGATQDVAIDALACATLKKSERGTANGLMFAGAYLGNALGGAGVLFLSAVIGFANAGYLAIGAILVVTIFVSIPLREPKTDEAIEDEAPDGVGRVKAIANEISTYAVQVFQMFRSSRSAMFAGVLALLPFGALSLSLVLGANLAVEFGMSDTEIAKLALVAAVVSAGGCVVGGFLSDRFGRRKMLGMYVVGMAVPPLVLAAYMYSEGYIAPIDPTMENRPATPAILVTVFWATSIGFSVIQGLMYGTRTALFMDVVQPKWAATQFTAYMSLLNVTIWYSATWQGWAIEKHGYPATLAADAVFGLCCIALLPFVKPLRRHADSQQLPAEPPSPPNV
jgi:PAT family beta-lactamase induction signal transducer AmpG